MLRFWRQHARLRLLPLYAAALLLLLCAEPTAWGLPIGAGLVSLGLALRLWGAGHLIKTERLATAGPYAHLRHPLYAGSLLIGLGFGLAAGPRAALGMLGIGLPLFLVYYLPYKERIESARLERRFGARYAAYRAAVPALIPLPRRFAAAGRGVWSLNRARANHELGTGALVTAGLALVAARMAVLP